MEEYVDCIDDKVYKNLYKVLNNYEMYKSIWGGRVVLLKNKKRYGICLFHTTPSIF